MHSSLPLWLGQIFSSAPSFQTLSGCALPFGWDQVSTPIQNNR